MSWSVRLLPQADRDAIEIISYIARRSADGAQRWRDAFVAARERVRSNPYSCGVAPESSALRVELRQALFHTRSGRTYRAVFVVAGDEAVVLRVRGPGQRPLRRRDLPDA